MMMRCAVICVAAFVAAMTVAPAAQALTMQECSAKYKAAQAAGTLKGMTWNAFRKAECGTEATTTAPAAPPATTGTTPPRAAAPAAAAPAAAGNAVFPTAVSPKYSSESAGKARMHTCLDQYNANKAGN